MDNFESKVLVKLTELATGQASINSHLEQLNGSVARHEKQLSEIQMVHAVEKATAGQRASFFKTISPALWAAVGIISLLLLQHAPKILEAIKS